MSYLDQLKQTTTQQMSLKYILQVLIREGLKKYAEYDYDIIKSDVLNNERVKANNEWLHTKIKVLRADPQTHEDVPAISINRLNDDESEQFLGDFIEDDQRDENGDFHTVEGSIFQEVVEIRVWSHNGDERDYIYHVLKYILFEIRSALADAGLINQHLSGGVDTHDFISYAPEKMFWATVHLSGLITLLSSGAAASPIEASDFEIQQGIYQDSRYNMADPPGTHINDNIKSEEVNKPNVRKTRYEEE